jgi:hypothetical protein
MLDEVVDDAVRLDEELAAAIARNLTVVESHARPFPLEERSGMMLGDPVEGLGEGFERALLRLAHVLPSSGAAP